MAIKELNIGNTSVICRVNITSLKTAQRRINKAFARGTLRITNGSFVEVNTPQGVFQYTTWDGICGVCQVATYRVHVPVLNILMRAGILAITRLNINTQQPGERRHQPRLPLWRA